MDIRVKISSKNKTQVNENVVREIGLKKDLVYIKVCAVNNFLSGLKCVDFVKDRKST